MNAILLPSSGKVYVDGIDTADEERLLDIRRTVGHGVPEPWITRSSQTSSRRRRLRAWRTSAFLGGRYAAEWTRR